MPRYFFHRFNDIEVPDLEGCELTDEREARHFAKVECREMMAEAIVAGSVNLSHRIEVEDIFRLPLFTVYFRDAIAIKG